MAADLLVHMTFTLAELRIIQRALDRQRERYFPGTKEGDPVWHLHRRIQEEANGAALHVLYEARKGDGDAR